MSAAEAKSVNSSGNVYVYIYICIYKYISPMMKQPIKMYLHRSWPTNYETVPDKQHTRTLMTYASTKNRATCGKVKKALGTW